MRKFILSCVIAIFSYSPFTYANEDAPVNNQIQTSANWEYVGKIEVYRDGSNSGERTADLYTTKNDPPMYKIKKATAEYIVVPNPRYKDSKSSYGRERFEYVAGDYYLNLTIDTILLQSTNWEYVGKITVYRDGSNNGKRTADLYMTKPGTRIPVYKIKKATAEYIVVPNLRYKDSKSSYGRERFEYVAGDYYMNIGLH